MDAIKAEKVDINLVTTSMNTFYEDLKSIDEKLGSNKETLKFLDTYHVSIADLMAALNMREGLKLLILYDYDHKKVYTPYLEN
jgi:hypothetical protein